MCGAAPTMVRSVSLYSTCSGGNLTVFGRTVNATERNDYNAPYQLLTTQSDDFSKKLYLFAEKTKRYICLSKRWKVISLPKKHKNEWCKFYEIYNGRYLRYRSAVDPTKYLGINKRGKAMTSPRGRQECYNFLKMNPNADVDQHNRKVSSMGGMKHREPKEPHTKKSSSIFRDNSNNALLEGGSSRGMTTTHHRHRHANSWKMRDETTNFRRRSGIRLFVNSNKY